MLVYLLSLQYNTCVYFLLYTVQNAHVFFLRGDVDVFVEFFRQFSLPAQNQTRTEGL